MNGGDIKRPSETNLARFDVMTDEEIEISEAPPLSDAFYDQATWLLPEPPVDVTIAVEPDVLAWFKAQGEDYPSRLSAAVRLYAEAHRSLVSRELAEHSGVKDVAQQEGVSINQFVFTAVAEKMSALLTEQYLEERAARGSRERYEAALAEVPDVKPEEYDKLPDSP